MDQGGLNEAGGIVAGALAILATIGGAARWLLKWNDRRQEGRAAKLQRWHDELKQRELRLDAERENEIRDLRSELEQVRGEHHALFQAFHLIAGALARLDPTNPTLHSASQLLAAAFKVDAAIPPDMSALLARAR